MMKSICLISVALAGSALAQTLNLDVKLGLWESTMTSMTGGRPPIDTSKMSPEMRKRIEDSMKATQAKGAQPHTSHYCLTKETLQDNAFFNPQQASGSCKRTIVTNTKTVADLKYECTNEKYPATGTMHFEALSPENVKGTYKFTTGPMNMNGTVTAKWISSDCGDTK